MNKYVLLILLALFTSNVSAGCKYYAYVSYGPAMYNGQLNEKQNAYKNSGLRKNQEGFRAVYTSYGQTTTG